MGRMSSLTCAYYSTVLWIFCLLAIIRSTSTSAAKEYKVGDSSGWNTGVDYASWASQNTFHVGDSLKFSYTAGVHTVQQVSAEDYKGCNAANAIMSGTTGTTTVKLDKAQTYYFICGVLGHCEGGMQLSVTVIDDATSKSAPSPTTVPTNHTSPSSASSTPTTTTPSPPSNPNLSSPSTPTTNLSNNSPFLHPSFSFFLIILLTIHVFPNAF
ncbi:hypothetical protein GOP47_0007106 [Adiantum capillus-veneris]|uniref:Phytocyanin domain-containing protein n=1 Tax=Adiantum capillus-veneris TaxID=13818 RepID=A0A9D4V0W4_ADICA|nr:hypothetical protein GOP47_0007106 [Adiantum capillus-veneris]